MKRILTLLTVLVFTSAIMSSYAQQLSGKVEGIVKDDSQKGAEGATITLLKAKDSTVAKIAAANKTGHYSFEGVPEGRYLVAITAIGFGKAYTQAFDINTSNSAINLKTTALFRQANSLAGVTVVAKKPLVEQKIDRTVVNVEAAVTNVGSSAIEVLEKSPGVSVDKDGNISLKGKEGVLVLVDGRPTQLSGADLANMLKSMPASQLDQIEIMTNPPARFDAAGNAGVINIKTKKNKQFGYNGTATVGVGYGRYAKYNESLNFNYRQGKVNLFTNLNHSYRKGWSELNLQRNLRHRTTKELESYFIQESNMHNEFQSFSGKLGMDYSPSKNTTLGFVVNGYSNPGTFGNRGLIDISDPNWDFKGRTRATADYHQYWKNLSANVNFRTVLDTTGRELTADLDYMVYDSRNDQVLTNTDFNASDVLLRKPDTLLGALPQHIDIYSGRIDYLHPLKKGARFEAGAKLSWVKTDNNARYDSLQNGREVNDVNRTNHFIYEESINAAYANLSHPLGKKLSAQLGLRLENTISLGNQITQDTTFDRSYTSVFPTAYFQYKANDKNNFGLNYGKRIRRPDYESLNPFIRFLDRYTFNEGNPELKPQFSHNIDLSHTYKNFLTTTLNYTRTTDIIQMIIEQRDSVAFAKRANIAKQRQYGVAVSANHPVTKWWTSSLYVNVYNNKFDGVIDNNNISVSTSTLALNGSQQFKFAKTWTAELGGFYRTGGVEGVMRLKSFGMLNLGISKQVMKNNGSIRLNVRDVLNTMKIQARAEYGNVDARFQEMREPRVVNLSFTYRFTKGKMNGGPKKRTNGSASEEQNRVGGGSGN
ncbi:MAG TPA: TonB-dependent receptor [Chitinophagaceae bacterium]